MRGRTATRGAKGSLLPRAGQPVRRSRSWFVAVVVLAALLAASCGTRADRGAYLRSRRVVLDTSNSSGGVMDPTANTSSGTDQADGGGGTAPSGDTGQSIATPGTGAPGTDPTASAAPGAGAADAVPDNVSSDEVGGTITIGMHLPETGAAPLPTEWADALQVVQQWLNDSHPAPGGRKYQFVVEDDGYDPATGLAACRKLAEDDPLLVIGHSQPAVQDACADLFGQRGIPYLMRGAQASLLDGRPLAWFGTTSDDLQGGMLADYAIHQLGGATRKAAVLYENDQLASRDSFIAHYRAGGGQIVAVEETQPRQPDFTATIAKLQQAGADLVFLSQPPVDVIKVAVQSQGQGYHPTWLGAGTYWNYNLVLESAGAALDGAVSFSPWPSVDSAAAAEYRDAYSHYRPGTAASDVGLVIWGWASVVRAVVEKAGEQLSRAAVVRALHGIQIATPTWTPLSYTTTDHIGSDSVAVFLADGQAKRWRQIADFQASF